VSTGDYTPHDAGKREVGKVLKQTFPHRCHPERRGCFASRSSRAVEGPLHQWPRCRETRRDTVPMAHEMAPLKPRGVLRLRQPIRKRMGSLRSGWQRHNNFCPCPS